MTQPSTGHYPIDTSATRDGPARTSRGLRAQGIGSLRLSRFRDELDKVV